MSKFKIGEIVIIQSMRFKEKNGEEATILQNPIPDMHNNPGYITDNPATDSRSLGRWDESSLRKLPPKDELISWEDCIFKPEAETTKPQ